MFPFDDVVMDIHWIIVLQWRLNMDKINLFETIS